MKWENASPPPRGWLAEAGPRMALDRAALALHALPELLLRARDPHVRAERDDGRRRRRRRAKPVWWRPEGHREGSRATSLPRQRAHSRVCRARGGRRRPVCDGSHGGHPHRRLPTPRLSSGRERVRRRTRCSESRRLVSPRHPAGARLVGGWRRPPPLRLLRLGQPHLAPCARRAGGRGAERQLRRAARVRRGGERESSCGGRAATGRAAASVLRAAGHVHDTSTTRP